MKFTIPDTHISYCEGHRSIILPANLLKNCLADKDKPNIIKKSLDNPFFSKNFISVKTNDSQFLIISLFQTLMIFQKTIHQNFINILISQYEKPSKPFFGNPKHHWIAQFFPSKPLNIHHLGWSGFPGPSQKLHLQDHPIRLRQWQLRTLCLFRSSQNLGFGQGVPPTEWSECLLLYIYIYIIYT